MITKFKIFENKEKVVRTEEADSKNPFVYYIRYKLNDELHRDDDEPAYIKLYKHGNVEYPLALSYNKYGKKHRDDENGNSQPSLLVWDYDTKKLLTEEYYKNDKKHRLNGPADITYFNNFNNIEKYYIKGEYFADKEEWLKYMSENYPDDYKKYLKKEKKNKFL
jgi:hypothetical protein